MRALRIVFLTMAALVTGLGLAPSAAEAHGHWYGDRGYYRPPPPRFYAPPPPPVYYRPPPPVYYAPPPPAFYGPPRGYYAPPPRYYGPPRRHYGW